MQQFDGTNLKPGQTQPTWISSQSAARQSGVRIVPTWASGADPVFLGFRTAAGGGARGTPAAPLAVLRAQDCIAWSAAAT